MCVVYVHALHYKQVPPHLDFLNMNSGDGTQVLVLLKRTTVPSVPSPQAQHARLAVHPSLKPSTLLLAPLEQPAGSSFLYIGRRASPRFSHSQISYSLPHSCSQLSTVVSPPL